jgi:phospholipid-binding lipoprotein MlaA
MNRFLSFVHLLACVVVPLLATSSALAQDEQEIDREFAPEDEIIDPFESLNRGIFSFNDTLDVHVLEPIARTYEENVPEPIQTGIGNFFANLRYPSYLVSDLIQGKVIQAGEHTGRFLINSTIGLAGLIDVAKDMGLPDHQEDFGIALAFHDVPPGPYLVLPILGPSNFRDGFGLIVDGFLDPIGWVGYSNLSSSTKLAIAASALGVKVVHTRAGLIQAIETGKESAVDYYLFVQGAYYQYRHGLLTDGKDDDDFGNDSDKQLDSESDKL